MSEKTKEQRLEAQGAEFDAMTRLAEAWKALGSTAVVDDDYPSVRSRYEGALRAFLEKCVGNDRLVRGLHVYRHKARGTEYALVGTATAQVADLPNIREGDCVTVYRSQDDGSLYVRKHGEFNDGRFELVHGKTGFEPIYEVAPQDATIDLKDKVGQVLKVAGVSGKVAELLREVDQAADDVAVCVRKGWGSAAKDELVAIRSKVAQLRAELGVFK